MWHVLYSQYHDRLSEECVRRSCLLFCLLCTDQSAIVQDRRQHRTEVVDADGMPTSQLAALLANLAGHQHCAAARHVDSGEHLHLAVQCAMNFPAPATTDSCMPLPSRDILSQLETTYFSLHTSAEQRLVLAEVYATIRSMLPGVQYHGGARMLLYSDPNSTLPKVDKLPGHVAIVCGSGADVQHAFEAKVALQLQGAYSTMIRDVSPTKLAELMSREEQLQAADAVIVCCGEQPALAGLVLGLVEVPVVAIPGTGGRPDPNLAVSVQGVGYQHAGLITASLTQCHNAFPRC